MGRRTGGRAAGLLAALLAPVLAFGLLTAPPAHAVGQLDEAAEALADGSGVWVAEGFEGAPETLLDLVRARYARAETSIRVAMVTEELGEDDAAAQQFAAAVGEPGVYLVYSETDDPTSDYPTTAHQRAVLGGDVTYEQVYEEYNDHLGSGSGNFLLSLPDALDGDLSPDVFALSDDAPFFVDPAVTDVFPDVTAEWLREVYADVETPVRVAVVTALGGSDADTQDALFGELPADGTAVLLRWESEEFSVAGATGGEAPFGVDDVESTVGGIGAGDVPPEVLPQRMALLAALLGPDPVELARQALVDDPVYVHPGVSDGETTAAEVDALRERLREACPSARAAFMPEEVLELRLGGTLPDADSGDLARLFVPESDGSDEPGTDVVVWTLSSEVGGYLSNTSATGQASFVEATQWTFGASPPISGALEELLSEVDDGGGGGGGLPDAVGDTGQLRIYLLVALGIALLWLGPLIAANATRRRRRIRATAKWRRRLTRLPVGQAREEQERADVAALAVWRDLVALGDDLGHIASPHDPVRLRALQRLRSEYERLLAMHDQAMTWHEVAMVRADARRLRRSLDVWLRTAAAPQPADAR
ncbi:hypothetical protein [Streptomyces avicenniae]|uniref:hypothetical protein n=1 Tax=Streptomyces avicenniae TaxID=500153 RepID=UPI00069BE316|nr:hypothetical protein [Streptomyces avicenniae]